MLVIMIMKTIMITISNGNRTEWSPIQSVIIWVINKIRRPRSGSPIFLITSMITDRIGWHEVLLPIIEDNNIMLLLFHLQYAHFGGWLAASWTCLRWQRDAVSEFFTSCVPIITWLCSRVMRFQSRPTNWPLLAIESPVAQVVRASD